MAKQIIQFRISRGDTHYVAEGVDLPVVTQGKTFDELIENLKEAIDLQLEGEDAADFDLAPHPSVLLNMELSVSPHA
ncbi:MAG: type II toxin-antitoxin system HicB family antitoxin [Patescibacteria group bacterium]